MFEGSNQYDRFNQIFLDTIRDPRYRDKFAALGMPADDFGTHSIRKGAVTFISTGTTSTPPIASICLRANWAMPGVMNRYIKFESAGDQFVGKCVSGRSRLTKDFAASSPYFDFSECSKIEKSQKDSEVDAWIKSRMPAKARSNDRVFLLFKNCVASLVFHRAFLKAHLHSRSNIQISLFCD